MRGLSGNFALTRASLTKVDQHGILCNMKTTIDIPDALMARCRAVIARDGVTFRSLVQEGLDRVLDDREQREAFKLARIPTQGGGFQPGFDDADWTRIRDEIYEGRGA